MKSLFESTEKVLLSKEIEDKTQGTQKLKQDFAKGNLNHDKAFPIQELVEAGYPTFLNFVAPKNLPRRRLRSPLGKVALLHSLAHIEFNAINLALDAVYRFQQMPSRYYSDWLKVAADEARHFQLLQARLNQLGSAYGEFPVHSGLWEMAENTAHDVLVRMALVP
ncbi:MAG: ferritin-like domain-containing protein, partial [SAR324 cluster bacterium]|nr:ferritin-like domain-containing protein [SAR324 cluster bacterium]